MTRLASAVAPVLLLLATAGCASGNHSQAQPKPSTTAASASAPAGGPRHLADLRDIGQLRSLFNTRSREPRLILLVSPT